MTHLHLQIQFASDFEGYATGSCTPPPPHHTSPFLFWLAAIHETLCRFFFFIFGQRVIAIMSQVWKK